MACDRILFMTENFGKEYIQQRRRFIESRFSKLNKMQLKAAMATEGPLLILAGAGSGKTTVLINRIANLLRYGRAGDCKDVPMGADETSLSLLLSGGEEAKNEAALDPVEPWRILAITFTNKAAGELKDRLERMLGEKARYIWACTFHFACVRILRRDAEKLGFTTSFTIYDTSDSISLIKRILKDNDLDEKIYAPKSLMGEISRAKDECITGEEYLNYAKATGDIRRIKYGEVYREYVRRLFAANAMDCDDLIFFTVKLLLNDPDVRDYWQRKFKYVLIDEYQDTNRLQYLLASTLAGGWGNICVVGDDDQSIYKFRGATIENILSFESQYKNCRTIRLEQNYRSTGNILDAANAVIRNNLGRKGKELWTNDSQGDKIELFVADNENEEAQYVASRILASYSHGGNFRDNAVLYRINAQSKQFEDAFKRNSIPYRIVGGTRFFDRAEIKDIISYLCVIASPSDDLRLMRIINTPVRGIGDRSIETARQLAANENISLFEVVSHADRYPELSRSGIRMREFANLINGLRVFAENSSSDEILDELLEKTGYVRALEDKNTLEDTARAENVRELKTGILTYIKESGDSSLEGYLANVSLYTDLDNYDTEADCVTLMTMHSAKGLEFDNVFIAGAEEGLFPGIRAIGEQDEMEEERRLCYVAITRAKKNLNITCAKQRMIFGKTTCNKVSRFVEEIPDENIRKNIPRGYSSREVPRDHSPRTSHTSGYAVSGPKIPAPAVKREESLPAFALGDNVTHSAFGEGVIVKMTPMGGDYLLEISFSKVGTKKLMLRAASHFMKKD